MTTDDRSQATHDPRLARILADYMEAIESRTAQDSREWFARYPEFATELREFIAGHARLHDMVEQAAAGLALQNADATTPLEAAADHACQSSQTVRYFGDYELLEEIARGGMGVVYRARQTNLNRIVALKMILAGQLAHEADVKRFYAEAEAAARLDHPGIVPIFEIGQHEGQHYFSMAYVAGESLARKVSEGPLQARAAAALVRDIADAVQYAHAQGVVHRDLKPANVLVDQAGQPRVADFGLAKQLSADSGLTGTGQILGTPSYMPPEQAAGKIDEIGPKSDVYSLGAILYCLLTGRPPFQAASPIDTLRQVLEQEPAPIRQLNVEVPPDLETVALKCLEKEPARRYGSAGDVSEELGRFLRGEPIVARRSTARERTWKWARRNPALARSLAAVVVLAIVLVVGTTAAAFRLAAAARTSRSLYLTSQSELLREEDPGLALVLALDAAELHPGPAANNAVLAAMGSNRELRTLAGHSGPITGLAVSADCRWIATASDDKTARLWDGATGAPVATLDHDAPVLAAKFTPDGRRLVSLSTNHRYELTQSDDYQTRAGEPTIRVWDSESGRLERSWKAPQPPRGGAVWEPNLRGTLDMSPDNSYAVVTFGGFPNRPPCVWNLADGKLVAELIGHAAPVHSVAFSPDGRRIVTASADQTARIWDAASGRQEFVLKGHSSSVWFATFNPAGTRVLTIADGNRKTYAMTATSVNVISESNADSLERAAGRLWNAATGNEIAALTWPKSSQGHDQNGFVGTARFSRDGTRIVTAGHGSSWGGEDPYNAAVWDAESGAFVASLRWKGRSSETPLDAALSPDGTLAAAVFDDKQVHLWDSRTGRHLLTLKGHHGAVRNVEFAPDGDRLISTSDDGAAQIWDLRLIDDDDRRRGIWPDVQTLVFNSACDRVAAVKITGQFEIAILDATTREEHARAEINGASGIDRPLFSADGKFLLLHTRFQPFALYDAQTGKRLRQLGGPLGYVGAAISPDGRFVAATTDGDAVLWETASGRELARLPSTAEHQISNVLFSPDGRTLLTMNSGPGRSAGSVVPACLWDVPSGRKRAELSPQSHQFMAEPCRHASFSPDGRRAATAIGDSAQIWDVASGREVVAGPHQKLIHLALFMPDGRSVLTTGADGRAVLWNAASGREIWRLKGVESEEIYHAEVTLDGRFLLTASREHRQSGSGFLNGAARLWDAATGAELCTLFRHESNLDSVTLSPDGRTAIVSYHGASDAPFITRTWPVDFLSIARARRPRNLTPQERARFELP